MIEIIDLKRNVLTTNEVEVYQVPYQTPPTPYQVPYYGYGYGIYPYEADVLLGIFFLMFFLMIPLVFMMIMFKMLGGIFGGE